MKHYCEMNESGFKFHFDSLLDGSEGIFPSGKKYIKMVYSGRILTYMY